MKNTKGIVIAIIVVIVLIGTVSYASYLDRKATAGPGPLDGFTQCLADSGAQFYGAFWCPHCQNQKALFSKSAKLIPYIECSTPDGQGQLPVCKTANITGYPTWTFKDGSRIPGEATLQDLAVKTSCTLPEGVK